MLNCSVLFIVSLGSLQLHRKFHSMITCLPYSALIKVSHVKLQCVVCCEPGKLTVIQANVDHCVAADTHQ
jgi:hypothetical protein